MSNITDVARLAGVSVATVSRVLNKNVTVSDKAREKVLDAIRQLGYNPNGVARNLRRQKSKIVLVILPSITNTFYSKVVRGMENMGRTHGYNVLLCTTGNDKDRELLYLDMIKTRQADGVIFLYSTLSDEELRVFGGMYPAVQCSEYKEQAGIVYVSIDNILAAEETVAYLAARGHRRIAMVSERQVGSSALREIGYQRVLAKRGIDAALIEYGDYSYQSGYKAAQRIFEKQPETTAIFAISDLMAMGCIRAAMDMGFSVPDRLAVSGFDNILYSHMFPPELTTVSQPRYQMGEAAMELLIAQIEKGKKIKQKNILMPHRLIIRGSTEHKNKEECK